MAKAKLEVDLPKKTVVRGGILALRAMTPKRIRDAFARYTQIKSVAPVCAKDGMVERSLKCTPADPNRFRLAENAIAALEAEWRQVEALLEALEKPFGLDHLDQAEATRLVGLLWAAWSALGLAATREPSEFPRWAMQVLPHLGEMSEYATRREWAAWYEGLKSQPIRINVDDKVEGEVERAFAEALPHLLSPGRKLDPEKLKVSKGPMPKLATLAELVKAYETWERRTLASSSIDAANQNNTAVFRVLLDVLGADRMVHTLEQGDVEHLADVLLALPPGAHGVHKRDGTGFVEIAAEARAKRIQDPAFPRGVNGTTRRKYSTALNSLFTFARKRGWSKELLEVSLHGRGRLKDESQRSALAPDQLRKLFHRAYFDHSEAPVVNRWILPVALYQGARIGEIAQLDSSDVYLDNETGRWVVVVAEDGYVEEVIVRDKADDGSSQEVAKTGKKWVKNPHSIRKFPLHTALVEMGFVDFVLRRRDQGHAKLFNVRPVPQRGKLYYYSSVRDSLTQIYKDVGVHKVHAFTPNSMRHTWVACALRQRVLNEHRNALGGWKLAAKVEREQEFDYTENAQQQYARLEGGEKFAFPIRDLFEALERVQFAGLFQADPPETWRPALYEKCSSKDEPKKRLTAEEKAARYELKKKREQRRLQIKRLAAKNARAAQAASTSATEAADPTPVG